jgi:hypothetical protein
MQEVKLCLDPGYSAFKFAIASQGNFSVWREPTVISLVPDFQGAMDGVEPDDSCNIEWQGKKYLVGNDATSGLRIFQEDSFEFLYKQALPLFLLKLKKKLNPFEDRLQTLAVCVSPADFYHRDEITTAIKEIFSETQIKLYPQGLGAWILSGMPGDCAICDIGYNTVDLLPFCSGKFQKEKCKSFKGAGVVNFLKNLSYDDPHNLVSLLEKGDEKIKQVLQENYPDYLASIIQPYVSSRVIFTGGGALFVKGAKMPFKYAISKDPVFANVRGVATLI